MSEQTDDDWENFATFSENIECENDEAPDQRPTNLEGLFQEQLKNPTELSSTPSVEDLVNNFEEGLVVCFHPTIEGHTNDEQDLIRPSLFEQELLPGDKIWGRVLDNYGRAAAIEWKTLTIREKQLAALEISEKTRGKVYEERGEKSSGDELDFHKMIDSEAYQTQKEAYFITTSEEHGGEVMQTADEVIEELEGMMHNAELQNAAVDYETQQRTGIVFDDVMSLQSDLDEGYEQCIHPHSPGSTSSQEEAERGVDLKVASLSELNILNEELEAQVQVLSSELLRELDHRDSLQFENEVKNTFISKVLEVQYKRDQFLRTTNNNGRISLKNLGRGRKNAAVSETQAKGRYLTTVIPSNVGDVITLDVLQALIKILDAMKSDSDNVPSLLTSYILKVLCPAPEGHSNHVLEL